MREEHHDVDALLSSLTRAQEELRLAEWDYERLRNAVDSAGELALARGIEERRARIDEILARLRNVTTLRPRGSGREPPRLRHVPRDEPIPATEPPRVSVVMPTYGQAQFVARAIESLRAQELQRWELLVIDDGSPDQTAAVVAPYLDDVRIRYFRFAENRGLGAALNEGLAHGRAPLVAYLPSDDVVYGDHLTTLVAALDAHPEAVLAFSGVKYEHRIPGKGVVFDGTSFGQISGYPIQLVQAMHRRTEDRWTERSELTTDDLDRMFWSKLRARGEFVETRTITCE